MDLDINIVFQFLLSFGLWALIWMERGIKEQTRTLKSSFYSFWEIRTFSLISFLWAISSFLAMNFSSEFFIVISIFIIWAFILTYYIYWVFKEKQLGITTELSAIATFFLWVFVMIWFSHLAIVLAILITFLLSSKFWLSKVTEKISERELINTLKFAIISVVILPLLPDEKYSLNNIFHFLGFSKDLTSAFFTAEFLNPYGIWFFVVLMSGISYIGYIMSKFIWEKWSILASGAIWWLISSTAVTASMTERSKKDKRNTDMYVVSTLIASTIMFVRVVLIVLFFNINIFPELIIPSLFMFLGMVAYIYYFYRKWKSASKNIVPDTDKFESPFSIWPAFKFAIFVLFIKFVSAIGWAYKDVWWDYFFYGLWIISGLADVDAISQTMAVDALDSKITISIATITIIIAVISNNLVKGTIAFRFGEARFWKAVMWWFLFSMLMWIIWISIMKLV